MNDNDNRSEFFSFRISSGGSVVRNKNRSIVVGMQVWSFRRKISVWDGRKWLFMSCLAACLFSIFFISLFIVES